jgi:ABC-type antimicrobial peptide transport system permease subunit
VRAARRVPVADEEARRIATALNPSLPLTLVMSMDETLGRARREWDSLARLLGILAGLAAVLACIGLYGVVAHGVAQRYREFGIRSALGASRGDVWRLVLRQSATIVGAGLALGLIGAYAFAQILSAAGRRESARSSALVDGRRRPDCRRPRGIVEARVRRGARRHQRDAASAVISGR